MKPCVVAAALSPYVLPQVTAGKSSRWASTTCPTRFSPPRRTARYGLLSYDCVGCGVRPSIRRVCWIDCRNNCSRGLSWSFQLLLLLSTRVAAVLCRATTDSSCALCVSLRVCNYTGARLGLGHDQLPAHAALPELQGNLSARLHPGVHSPCRPQRDGVQHGHVSRR